MTRRRLNGQAHTPGSRVPMKAQDTDLNPRAPKASAWLGTPPQKSAGGVGGIEKNSHQQNLKHAGAFQVKQLMREISDIPRPLSSVSAVGNSRISEVFNNFHADKSANFYKCQKLREHADWCQTTER